MSDPKHRRDMIRANSGQSLCIATHHRSPFIRGLWLCLGWVALFLGAVGAVLPVMPTVPFILLAALAFGRGSPRLRAWMINHPRFGPIISDWETTGAIAPLHKLWAVTMMAASVGLAWFLGIPTKILIIQGVILVIVAAYLLSRPNRR